MNLQYVTTVIIDKARFSKPVHEEADSRPSRAYHSCERLLAYVGNPSFGFMCLAKLGKQQENSRQAFFAGIEKLINEVRLESDVAGKQIRR